MKRIHFQLVQRIGLIPKENFNVRGSVSQ